MGECDLWNLDLPGVLGKTPRLGGSPQVSLSHRQWAALGYPRGLYGCEKNILFQKGVEYLNSLISLAVLLRAPLPSGLYTLCLVLSELSRELHQCDWLCPVLENCWVFGHSLCLCSNRGRAWDSYSKGKGKESPGRKVTKARRQFRSTCFAFQGVI